jgi:predicted ATPase/class 3 adenylate cyclase
MEQYGKYQLLRRIGRGGMAEVFLAKSPVAQGLAKTLVIKKIHPAFAKSNQFIKMFKAEADIALSLNHPSIVQVFDYGQVGGTYFLAMEYVEGLDVLRLMQQCAQQRVPMPFGLSAYIVQQTAKALDYAHRKLDEYGEPARIVHRDVSPQNVLVSWDGAVKIVDFGISHASRTLSAEKRSEIQPEAGVISGKFAYMSPEQARGEPVDHRSDVFSAGIVLYELVCGQQAFKGKGKEVLELVKAGAIKRPRDLNPDVPAELEETIVKALAYHRDDRYQTGRDLQNALGRFLFRFADEEDGPIDSGRLAQFIARVVPADKRRAQAPPPTARAVADGTPLPHTGAGRDPAAPDTGSAVVTSPRAPVDVRERKNVFVLEGRVCGRMQLERRLGAEAAASTVGDFFKIARDVAYKNDAHVHHTDAHGFTFVVGLPVAAEDDASRAIRLSLALIDALDAVGQDVEPELRLAVGLQRGVALLRRTGGSRFSYELSDTSTEVARRLAKAATGAEVLVGGGAYRVTQADWNFEELASIEMPGDPDTQPGFDAQRAKVYKLRGPKERAQRMRERAIQSDKDLIGRDLELKALRDAYRDVLVTRRKRHIVILGEAGVGKRSLVSAFLAGIPRDEAVITRAAARAATSYTPYAIIADLARDLLGLAEGADGKEARRRIEMISSALYPDGGREVRGLTQAVGMLLGARFDDDDEEIDATERRQRIREALLRVEQRLSAEKALVVVGEDVHWADEQSAELFVDLLKVPSTRPILGIVTGRPDPRVVDSATETNADVITLDELGSEARVQLVTNRFVRDEDVTELARQIVSRTGGNPFFINEVLDSLVERGTLVADDADGGLLRWVDRDAPIQVPTRIEALVTTRIDMLPPAEKQTLMLAAVMGRVFTQAQLDALAGRATATDLAHLVERGMIARADRGFAFRNEMTMSVAYQLLPAEDRRKLHLDAAERLSTAPSYRTGQDDAVIARHLELAGDTARAAARYMQAAEHANNVGGGADALRQLTRALKLLGDGDHAERFEARRMREAILRNLAKRPQQLREIDRMRKQAEAMGDNAKLARAQALLTQFYIDVGKAPAARRAVGPALEAARAAGEPLLEAEARRLEASIARLVGNHDEALELCRQALELCDDSRAGLLQRASVLNVRGTILWHCANLQHAIEAYAEALVIYRMLKRPRDEARVLNNMGIVFAELGEFEEALAHYKSSLKIDQELGDRASLPLKLGNIGQTYTDLGDNARGERYLNKALNLAEQGEDDRSATDVVISLGQVYLQRKDSDRALGLFERGLELANASRDRYQEIRALVYLSLAQLESGRPPEGALELAENATRLAAKMPMPVGEIFGLAAQGLALAKLGRAAEGAALAARAVALQNEARQPEGAEQILHIHAMICEQAGNLEDARSSARRAHEEVQAKAKRLRDTQLRDIYLASPTATAIAADFERLLR